MTGNIKIALIAAGVALAVTYLNNHGYLDFLAPKVETAASE